MKTMLATTLMMMMMLSASHASNKVKVQFYAEAL